ncbi:defensin alpha-like protein 1 [Peromyscus leucopus]|uniref:defensin alpha-like protein 1 n=1 Tax=Peromyscus leucopus TaxID=10041 RepID=UPI001885983D|nr:defensin alpha-like protein 1 [Peromyscus leucopus]
MKTLVLLSALVLLAYLAQADSLPEVTEETKDEDQPVVEDQDVSISFGGPESSALQEAARGKPLTCSCRRSCKFFERVTGICLPGTKHLKFCCH